MGDVIKHELAPDLTIYQGHVLDALALIPDESVQCVCTSPPFWGLRDYSTAKWEGGDPGCTHKVRTESTLAKEIASSTLGGGKAAVGHSQEGYKDTCHRCGARRVEPTVWGGHPDCVHEWTNSSWRDSRHNDDTAGGKQRTSPGSMGWRNATRTASTCAKCGAWRGQLGLEPSPELFVDHLVLVFREVRRVLRKDGVLWINLGDSYCGSGVNDGSKNPGLSKAARRGDVDKQRPGQRIEGLKNKDLVGIPWRVAFALQADGWYLRSAPPWVKANCMPESVEDRPTTAHENVFLFSKSQTYFWDADAIREPSVARNLHDATGGKYAPPGQPPHTGTRPPASATFKRKDSKRAQVIPGQTVGTHRADRKDTWPTGSRNRRTSDWWNESLDLTIGQYEAHIAHLKSVRDNGGLLADADGNPLGFMVNTKPFKDAHFAVFPEELVRPMILAGTSPQACPHCLAPWKRVTEKERSNEGNQAKAGHIPAGKGAGGTQARGADHDIRNGPTVAVTTIGWAPTCSCVENDGSGECVVLDPFSGSGTTGMVARALGRAYIGCELNPEYVAMSAKRLLGPLEVRLRELETPTGPTQATLFDTADEAQ